MIEAYMKYRNNHFKIDKEEYENSFHDYRKIEEEMEKPIIEKVCVFPIHQFLQQINLIDLLWDFDAVSLYPGVMSDESSICPRIETSYAYTPDKNSFRVEKNNNQTFTKGSAFSKIK